MGNPEFYARQYSAIVFALKRAVAFMEQGHSEEAKTLLQLTILAAEEARLQAAGEAESAT